MDLGHRIASRRRQLHLSQEYVAEQLGVSRQAVSKWETGQTEPTAKNLTELARLFGMTVSELVEPERIQKADPPPGAMNWRLGLERFAIVAYSAAMILSTIETSDPLFPVFTGFLALIPAILMAVNILRLPAQIRTKMAVRELCYCLTVYCVAVFLEPLIRNVFASVIILVCCVVYVKYFRFPYQSGQ